jgi:hypothetical protein
VRPLLIAAEQRDALERLRIRAAKHPVDIAGLSARLADAVGMMAHKATITSQTLELPVGYLVSFTVETGHPVGTCRHMTLSVMSEDAVPTLEAVGMVAEQLGFVGGVSCCVVWLEKLQGHGLGVSVVQPVNVGLAGRA